MHLIAIHTIQYNDTNGVQHAAEPGSLFEFFGDTDRLLELGAVRHPSYDEIVLAGLREEQPSLELQPAIEPMVNGLSIPPLVLQSPAVPLPLDPVVQTPAVTLVAEDTVAAPVEVKVISTLDPAELLGDALASDAGDKVIANSLPRRRRRAAAEAPVAETVDVQPEPEVEESPTDAAVDSTETEAAPAPEGEDDLL